MKFALPILLVVAFALNACTTLANRRDLYSPARASGPYTDKLATRQMEVIESTNTRPKPH